MSDTPPTVAPTVSLAGRTAVVTGGESGIGAACADALAAAGADVAIFYYVDRDAAEKVATGVRGHGRQAATVKVDVSSEAAVEAGFDNVRSVFRTADILVNSAGINMAGVRVADMALDQWQRMLAADLTGSFLTCRRFVRDLAAEPRPAAIINITSIHAFAMRDGGADYGAAKGGQTNLTRTLALEVAAAGITVNAIAPGMILTPMNERALHDPTYLAHAQEAIPARRAGRPEEVAALAAYLASPAAAYITGAQLVIDGGLSLVQGTGA